MIAGGFLKRTLCLPKWKNNGILCTPVPHLLLVELSQILRLILSILHSPLTCPYLTSHHRPSGPSVFRNFSCFISHNDGIMHQEENISILNTIQSKVLEISTSAASREELLKLCKELITWYQGKKSTLDLNIPQKPDQYEMEVDHDKDDSKMNRLMQIEVRRLNLLKVNLLGIHFGFQTTIPILGPSFL